MRKLTLLMLALFALGITGARAQTATATMVPSSLTYSANGGTITFTVSISYTGDLQALAVSVGAIPPKWSYGQTVQSGKVPEIAPRSGDQGSLGFAYTTRPSSPVSFSFTVQYPSGLTGAQKFTDITVAIRNPALQNIALPDIILNPESGIPTGTMPTITTQPSPVQVAAGGTATFSVVATGTVPLSYRWQKDGQAISGVTDATLTITGATAADGGAYSVTVSNAAGSVSSTTALLVVGPASSAPTITTQPVSQSVATGASVSFTVGAAGSAPLSYQWRKDGVDLAGRTDATLALSNVPASAAGTYTCVVRNSAGSITSAAAVLTVTTPVVSAGNAYFGTVLGDGGPWALWVRPNRSAVFMAYLASTKAVLLSTALAVDSAGRFHGEVGTASKPTTIDGGIDSNGIVAATAGAFTMTGGLRGGGSSPAAGLAGYYEAGVSGAATTASAVVGPDGYVTVITSAGAYATGLVDAGTGAFDLAANGGTKMAGMVNRATGTISLTIGATAFSGGSADRRTDTEKLTNISTRSQTTSGASVLIAGFVITGDQPKPVLIRAVGPTLAGFGLSGALAAAHLEVFREAAKIAAGDNWGAAGNASTIAATASRLGAFALPADSRDASLLLTLEPGAYSAVVTGQGGVSGVALVEVYDATAGAIARDRRIVNISTRASAGTGDNVLIAGFVVTGEVPKRVLVRAAGPSLTALGVSGALARPQLTVIGGGRQLAQNAGWSGSPDADAIAAASARVGAFAFASGSQDAAVLLYLNPGAYTAQASPAAGAADGVALIEVYEVP